MINYIFENYNYAWLNKIIKKIITVPFILRI